MDEQNIMTTAEAVMDTVGENAKSSSVGSAIATYGIFALAVYGGANLAKKAYIGIKNAYSKHKESKANLEVVESETSEESDE